VTLGLLLGQIVIQVRSAASDRRWLLQVGYICLPENDHNQAIIIGFYRAMHYSAKRGIEIACRPSVRLSVCEVGGIRTTQVGNLGN